MLRNGTAITDVEEPAVRGAYTECECRGWASPLRTAVQLAFRRHVPVTALASLPVPAAAVCGYFLVNPATHNLTGNGYWWVFGFW